MPTLKVCSSVKVESRKSRRVLKTILTATVVCLLHLSLPSISEAQITLASTNASSVDDGVDVMSGKLENKMPLLSVQGRGEAKVGLYLPLRNLDWVPTIRAVSDVWNYSYTEYYEPRLAPTNYYGLAATVPLMSLSRGGYGMVGKIRQNLTTTAELGYYHYSVNTLEFISNDGTIMNFRDVATDGQPKDAGALGCRNSYQVPPPPIPQACSRGRIFRSTKGENAIFVADNDVYDVINYDVLGHQLPSYGPVSGTLYLTNGTKLSFANTYGDVDGYNVNLSMIEDRNGNLINLEYSSSPILSGGYGLTKITDSLKREVTITYGDSNQSSFYDEIGYRGFGGAERKIRVNYTSVENTMLPGHSLTPIFPGVRDQCTPYQAGACPGYPRPYGTGTPAPSQKVVSSITLPDQKEYHFYYNEYLEIARVKNPLESYVDYDYSGAIIGGDADGYAMSAWGSQGINRRVASIKNYDEAGVLVTQKIFGQPVQLPNTQPTAWLDNVLIEVVDGTGNVLNRSKHYFYGTLEDRGFAWRSGKEYKSEILNPASNEVLRRIETTWEQRALFPYCSNYTGNPPSYPAGFYICDETNFPGSSPLVDPRVTEITTTLETGQITKKTFSYDQYNNLADTYEYDYGNGQPGALLRRSHTDYLTDPNYTNNLGPNLKSLPLQTWVSTDANGNTKASLIQYEYDHYDVNPLISRDNVSSHDTVNYGASNNLRGNPTNIISYREAQNLTGAISSQAQYDILGNVVKTIDPKGIVTIFDFSDRFGSPDADARANAAPSGLGGQNTFAHLTGTTNPLGYTTFTQFDYFSGLAVDSEDINENVSTTYFNDVFDRPTQIITANNRPTLRSQTTIEYDDVSHKTTETSDVVSFGDNHRKTEELFNSLGQKIESRLYEGGGYIITNKFEYDSLGRVVKASNPYRPYLSEQAVWKSTIYDVLGRVSKVITPDNQEAITNYLGNAVTASDQAGKKRRSIANAIGQIVRVDEPNSSNDLGGISTPTQPTYYTYNGTGKLVKVSQGQQNRYFLYDSLGRLIRIRQPEQGTNPSLSLTDPVTGNSQWSAATNYDPNGNILSTMDSKGIQIAQTYDNLNRPLVRTYSDGTAAVSYEYDNVAMPFSRGKTTKISSSISTTEYTSFDALGRVLSHKQTIDGQSFPTSYVYDLSGLLTEETYPSGRIVKTGFNYNGQLENVSSKSSSQSAFHTYAGSFTYTASGAISSVRYGNNRWQTTGFNSRQQITNISLGSSQGEDNLWTINYEYGQIDVNEVLNTQQNNGNIARQTISFAGQVQSFVQSYRYDPSNRLVEAKEVTGTTQTWSQSLSYDVYGNRTTFNQQKVGELPITTTPAVDPATNRFIDGQGFTYDSSGNITQDSSGRQFTFSGDNKQVQVKDSAQNVIGLYYYDGDGARVKKVTASEYTIFVYDAAGRQVAEYSNQVAASPTTNYLTTDALGSPRVITDNGGNVVSRRDFMPFGEELYAGTANRVETAKYSATGSDNVRKRFTGYEKDQETGLDYAEARMYDNQYGRFTAVDPMIVSGNSDNPQSFNRYVYLTNNPINDSDSTGMWSDHEWASSSTTFFTPDPSSLFMAVTTDFVDSNSGDKTHIPDGKDQVMIAGTKEIQFMVDNFSNDRPTYDKTLAWFENSDRNLHLTTAQFDDLAGVIYAEASKNNVPWQEAAAIYGALNNRAAANGTDAQTEANAPGVYGAAHKNLATSPNASQSKLKAVYLGIARGIYDGYHGVDYSGGAYYWQGVDFSRHFSGMHAYESFYLVGFHFTSTSHDVFKMGDHKSGNRKWDYKYESTAGYGKTVFMRLTQAWKTNNGATKWNGR